MSWYEKPINANSVEISIKSYISNGYDFYIATLSDVANLIEDFTTSDLSNGKLLRTELKNNWRFILERVNDSATFDVTFEDPSLASISDQESTSQVAFSTPNVELHSSGNETYRVTNIYNHAAPTENIAPVITKSDGTAIEATVTLAYGAVYTEVTAQADTGETVIVGGDTVDTSVAGDYVVTYTATDASMNQSIVTQTVTVQEPPKPTVQNRNETTNENEAKTFTLSYTPAGESSTEPDLPPTPGSAPGPGGR